MANENKYLDYAGVSALWGKIKNKISADIGTLDVAAINGNAGKTITSISETNGKIAATYSDIAIAQSAVGGLTAKLAELETASTNHTHGNITSAGAITATNVAIANGDALVITDASDSNKLAKTSAVFDGSTTTAYLTKKGTFQALPTATTTAKGMMQVGTGLSVNSGTVSINSTSATAWNNAVTVADAAATVAAANAAAISAMDFTATGLGAGKTITALTQEDGKITVTASDISITKSQISDFPSSMAPTSHTHGNITNDGKIGSTAKLPLITTTNGAITTGLFGTAAGSFAEGNHNHNNTYAPIKHDSSATTYGVGTTANYGHVKIVNGDLSGATHSDGIVAGKAHTHSQYVTQAEFDDKLKVADAMRFKGVVDSTHSLPATHNVGDTYKVAAAGTYAGQKCELGDMIICQTSGTAAKDDDWTILQTNIDGAVTGPASSTANHIVTFDDKNGKVIQDSGKTVTTTVGTDDTTLPTSLAVKSFVEGKGYKTTDEHVTAVGNHYTPTATTTINAANGTATQLPTGSTGGTRVNVVVGLSADAAGHITSVISKDIWSSNTDTKNTAGTTNKSGEKMYLVGATAQGNNPQTYSNSSVYIGTDNCLYSNGAKVLTTATDTKNTAGSNADSGKLYIVGAKEQSSGTNGVQTYSNANAYVSGGYVYSNGQQIVALTPITTGEIDTICR